MTGTIGTENINYKGLAFTGLQKVKLAKMSQRLPSTDHRGHYMKIYLKINTTAQLYALLNALGLELFAARIIIKLLLSVRCKIDQK